MAKTITEAKRAGRRWAEREADSTDVPTGSWRSTWGEALPLVEHKDEDRRHKLAEIANEAARSHWNTLVRRAHR